MFKEHDTVVLNDNLTAERLKAGDVGTIVHVHPRGAAFVVEFLALSGDTVAVATVSPSQVRPVDSRDMAHARQR